MAAEWAILSILLYAAPFAAARELPREKPNIVWILPEDNSKHYLKLYDEGEMESPATEARGAHGLVFDRALPCGPAVQAAIVNVHISRRDPDPPQQRRVPTRWRTRRVIPVTPQQGARPGQRGQPSLRLSGLVRLASAA